MKKIIACIHLIIFASISMVYGEDPFSRSFTNPVVSSTSSVGFEGGQNVDDGVHPMLRYDVKKYYVKGVVISDLGSLAVISVPGSQNEILFLGDPLGNNMHTIKKITNDFIIAGNNEGEDVSISVLNPLQSDVLNQ